MSNHEYIRSFSDCVGLSGYDDAMEWSVIHPNGPQMVVIVSVRGNHPGFLCVLVYLTSKMLGCLVINIEVVLLECLADLVN